MMVVVMPVIVGMIVIMPAPGRMVVAATAIVARTGFLPTALPPRQQHKEKTGSEHEGDDDGQVHNYCVTNRTVGRVSSLVERATKQRWFSDVTTWKSPAIVES